MAGEDWGKTFSGIAANWMAARKKAGKGILPEPAGEKIKNKQDTKKTSAWDAFRKGQAMKMESAHKRTMERKYRQSEVPAWKIKYAEAMERYNNSVGPAGPSEEQ